MSVNDHPVLAMVLLSDHLDHLVHREARHHAIRDDAREHQCRSRAYGGDVLLLGMLLDKKLVKTLAVAEAWGSFVTAWADNHVPLIVDAIRNELVPNEFCSFGTGHLQ